MIKYFIILIDMRYHITLHDVTLNDIVLYDIAFSYIVVSYRAMRYLEVSGQRVVVGDALVVHVE